MRREGNLAVEIRLGAEAEPNIRERFCSAYVDVFSRRHELLCSLLANEISPVAYFTGIDDLLSDTLKAIAADVGAEACQRYFGFTPEQRFRVVDPDIGLPSFAAMLPQTDRSAQP